MDGVAIAGEGLSRAARLHVRELAAGSLNDCKVHEFRRPKVELAGIEMLPADTPDVICEREGNEALRTAFGVE